jgi:AraC-like DNA-binding protein
VPVRTIHYRNAIFPCRSSSVRSPSLGHTDVLDEVLQSVRLRSAVYCRARMSGGWGFRVERRDHARFHFIKSGRCWLETDNSIDPIQLDAGDLVILTSGQAHSLRSTLDSRVEPLAKVLERFPLDQKKNFVWETGSPTTIILCGGFRLEEQRASPLLSTLPPVMLVRERWPGGNSLRAAFELAEAELLAGAPGSDAFVSRMSDVIFLQAVRATLKADSDQLPGFIRGLKDPAIGQALTAMHSHLNRPWNVETLARDVGMSRSSFSSRFAELVGEPPMTYLGRWRMNRAAFWLRSSDEKVLKVATAVGYDSEVALSRAFKRLFGLTPGAYRRLCAAANSGSKDSSPADISPLYPSDFALQAGLAPFSTSRT